MHLTWGLDSSQPVAAMPFSTVKLAMSGMPDAYNGVSQNGDMYGQSVVSSLGGCIDACGAYVCR